MSGRWIAAFAGIVLFVPFQVGLACTCGPARPACVRLDGYSVVFLGTVTDTGPTIRGIEASELPAVEGEFDFSDVKRGWALMLPEEAQTRLEAVDTEDELEQLVTEYFPVPGDWSRPVQFHVEETFKGEHLDEREVWTGQGFGDCGFGFELGEQYLAYAYLDRETGRDETGICTRTNIVGEVPDEEFAYLRAVREGTAQPKVVGVITEDPDEFYGLSRYDSEGPTTKPLANARITLRSEDGARVARTDPAGRFAFEELTDGSYSLSAAAEGYRFPGLPVAMDLKAPACSVNVILAEPVDLER